MALFHRHSSHRPDPQPGEEFSPTSVDTIGVVLSAGLNDLGPMLQQALGKEFTVRADDGEGTGIGSVVVVGPVGPTGIGFLRATHPTSVLLVVDRRGRG